MVSRDTICLASLSPVCSSALEEPSACEWRGAGRQGLSKLLTFCIFSLPPILVSWSAFILNILGSALGQVHSPVCRMPCTPGDASHHPDSKIIYFYVSFLSSRKKETDGPSPILFIVIFYPFMIYYYFNGV